MSNKSFEYESFVNPPGEYGIVSFYWWVGEPLTKERLLWQLDRLEDMDICGLQINYCHTDSGGKTYGLPFKSQPEQFTDDWWELFGWFTGEAKKRGMNVSVSDYTLGTAGQGYFMDEILAAHPDICGRRLTYNAYSLNKGEVYSFTINPDRISLVAFREGGNITIDEAPRNVTEDFICPDGRWKVAEVLAKRIECSLDPMHPLSGKEMVRTFFDKFEAHFPGECGKALNFFFSDELDFGIRGNLWNDYFADEFVKIKGYDVGPYLAAVFEDIGSVTQKIRLDYYDVLVTLEERCYFEPVYRWHEERNMTYGCDHGGRGRDVTEFGDYFRTQKYNQGPGNDQPGLSSDIIKNKVASSISHLYNRPRTWLEGFYGSGWGTSTAQVADAVYRNFAMGHNLLSLHGLYYTTYGGFFEWAPPCNHFRMPYWKQMKTLNRAIKRLAYMNTRGTHHCNVAVIYPVAAAEGGIDGENSIKAAFDLGEYLYKNGVDFDFIDFESLNRAEAENGLLKVAVKEYKAVIVPSMKTIRFGNLETLSSLHKKGGLVLCFKDLPEASDRFGRDDSVLDKLVGEIFTEQNTVISLRQILERLDAHFERDFKVLSILEDGVQPYILHRRDENTDFYMVYGLPRGTRCYFNAGAAAAGTPVLYDSVSGKKYRLAGCERSGGGTIIPMPMSEYTPQIIAFQRSEEIKQADNGHQCDDTVPLFPRKHEADIVPINGKWKCELIPTMDNTFGDFSLPADGKMIGAQLRRPIVDGKRCTVSFGAYFKVLGPVPKSADYDEIETLLRSEEWEDAEKTAKSASLSDYSFSMRYGREGDPGHQGWHGLKGKVTDEFITLGARVDAHHEYHYDEEISCGVYYMMSYVYSENGETARIRNGTMKPEKLFINGRLITGELAVLKQGFNYCLLKYPCAGRTYFALEKEKAVHFVQNTPLAMSFYNNPNILPFYLHPEKSRQVKISFDTPPGMLSMRVFVHGSISAAIDGKSAGCTLIRDDGMLMQDSAQAVTVASDFKTGKLPGGARCYDVNNPCPGKGSQKAEITVLCSGGEEDGAVLSQYIDFTCGAGEIDIGDWAEIDGLFSYSGGMRYKKNVDLPEIELYASRTPGEFAESGSLVAPDNLGCVGKRTGKGELGEAESVNLSGGYILRLGDVVSSATVIINGKEVGTLIAPPWELDITGFVKAGKNEIEVVVYNTLYNHYTTIPTKYNRKQKSGLLGPAQIIKYKKEREQ